MPPRVDRRSLLIQAAASGAALGGGAAAQVRTESVARMIETERATIQTAMVESGIGAAAVCLILRGEPVWLEGFGRTSQTGGPSVTEDTIFSIQSTSKNVTAVAVLLAVQEGLLDLDTPITHYLPDFTVNSRFEASPQERMTLRLLLSNRAGFTHEAPVGNNYEPASPSFEAHVRSVSRTWLRFPVGERYRYSNLGYDLAGYILEKRTGLAYAEWLRRKLFAPLSMRRTTADAAVFTKAANRAVGQHRGYAEVPLVTPLVASGGVYTSARDMAAYLSFHLARGRWNGHQILAPGLWAEMHGFAYGGDYGLGVMRTEALYGSSPVRLHHHRGGGFGFGCNLVYCPDAEVGWAALFNRPALAGYRFGAELLTKLIAARFGARTPRQPATALAPIQPTAHQRRALVGSYVGRNVRAEISDLGGELRYAQHENDAPAPLLLTGPDELFVRRPEGEIVSYRYYPATEAQPAHLECSEGEASLDYNDGPDDPPGPNRPEWQPFLGQYRIDQWGQPALEVTIERRRGYLYLNGVRLIVETKPGLFFTSDGEAVDFRGATPTWRNVLLRRA